MTCGARDGSWGTRGRADRPGRPFRAEGQWHGVVRFDEAPADISVPLLEVQRAYLTRQTSSLSHHGILLGLDQGRVTLAETMLSVQDAALDGLGLTLFGRKGRHVVLRGGRDGFNRRR